jgi:hypothetical protein
MEGGSVLERAVVREASWALELAWEKELVLVSMTGAWLAKPKELVLGSMKALELETQWEQKWGRGWGQGWARGFAWVQNSAQNSGEV